MVQITGTFVADVSFAAAPHLRRRLRAAMSADVAVVAPLVKPIGDLFADRIVAPLSWVEAIDLSAAGVETGETVDSMIKTVWREVPVSDLTKLKADAAGTSTRVGVWRQTNASLLAEEAPSLANLERVGSTGQAALTVDVDQTWPAYYVQIGVTAGAGADAVVTIEDGSPPYGGTYDTAFWVYGESGYTSVDTDNAVQETGEPDPPGIAPTATAWLRWTCPSPAPEAVQFELPSVGITGQVAIGIYTGSAVDALTSVVYGVAAAADGVTVEFAPTAGTVYSIQIATTDSDNSYEVLWSIPAEAGELQVPAAPHDYLRVVVFDRDGLTPITEIPRRVGVDGQEALNTPGMGSVSVPLNDPVMKAYNGLLRMGRWVKFYLGDTCISGFRIQNRTTTWVSSGERGGMVQTASGPTALYLLNDLVIYHDVWPARPDSPDTRFYSWASRPGKGDDRWYVSADWNNHVNASSQDDPPGDWKLSAKKRAKYGMPKKWPDPDSKWLWIKSDPAMNGGWEPPQPLAGRRYYRKSFSVAKNGTVVRMFVTADETCVVYLDGDEVIRRENREKGFRTFTKYQTTLSAGVHTIAILSRAADGGVKAGVGDGVDAMMFTMYKVGKDNKKDEVILRSNGTWNAWYGRNVPGWHRAQVLKNAVQEARERDNTTADLLSFDFDGLVDSEGKEWTDRFNQAVQIGTSGLDLQTQLSESGRFDVWVDPEDFKVYAWKRRGINRRKSVALVPGVNLLDYAAEQQDEIGNDFLIQYDGGFTRLRATASIEQFGSRETYVELGGVKDKDDAQDVVRDAIAAYRDFRQRSGSPEVVLRSRKERAGSVIAIPGAYPFLDYGVGDVIAAPNEDGRFAPYRVLALSFSEDEEGRLTFDPELEQVAKPKPIGESQAGPTRSGYLTYKTTIFGTNAPTYATPPPGILPGDRLVLVVSNATGVSAPGWTTVAAFTAATAALVRHTVLTKIADEADAAQEPYLVGGNPVTERNGWMRQHMFVFGPDSEIASYAAVGGWVNANPFTALPSVEVVDDGCSVLGVLHISASPYGRDSTEPAGLNVLEHFNPIHNGNTYSLMCHWLTHDSAAPGNVPAALSSAWSAASGNSPAGDYEGVRIVMRNG